MKIDNIIIQAGGKGTRLEKYTRNKPKCLVPVNNLPILFYAFQKFPEAQFHIICDYKKDVLEKYLSVFAREYNYCLIQATGRGTCAGLHQAIQSVGEEKPFLYMWSDLILSDAFSLPDIKTDENHLGISKDFECRWSYSHGCFVEKASKENGVAGLFVFGNGKILDDVPSEGGFVEYLSEKQIEFTEMNLYGAKEIGTIVSYNEYNDNNNKCRPFNKMIFDQDVVTKFPVTQQGVEVAKDETAWYRKVQGLNFTKIPEIYEFEPLKMSKITGGNIFEYTDLSLEQKNIILEKVVEAISVLHNLVEPIEVVTKDVIEVYVNKTFSRIEKVKNMIPFARDEYISVNGKICKNVFFLREELVSMVKKIMPQEFRLIHGDTTFSNLMLDSFKEEIILIDPRGYFGQTKYYGDEDYDWAKLFYSLVGNYDQYNRKNFVLNITEKDVSVEIGSNNWGDMEEYFFALLPGVDRNKIKLVHALIWLSLTTYTWEDYDAICGAFYNGLLYLNEVLDEAGTFSIGQNMDL